MSVECSTVVWKRDFGGASRKMVAVRLADHADDEGRGIWPAVEKVAAQCNLSCRTVQRVLADFVTEGILKIVSEGGKGPGSTRRYDFNMGAIRALPLAVPVPDAPSERTEKPENKGDMVSPLENLKGDTGDAKGDTDDKKGDTVSPKPSITIIEPSLERMSGREAPDGSDGKAEERAFKRAFARWPSFAADSDREARKAWDALATEARLQAFERMADYIASVKASGRSKFCAFSVYLSERRWERLPRRATEVAKPSAPTFGPAWSAICIVKLMAGPVDLGPPEVTRASKQVTYDGMMRLRGAERAQDFFRRQGFDFAEDGSLLFPEDFEDRLWTEHLLKHGFPEVNALYAGAALQGEDATHGQALAPLMEFVKADSLRFLAWQRFYAASCWPFPKHGRMPGLYFPAGGPDAFSTFEDAVRNHEHGKQDAAE